MNHGEENCRIQRKMLEEWRRSKRREWDGGKGADNLQPDRAMACDDIFVSKQQKGNMKMKISFYRFPDRLHNNAPKIRKLKMVLV